MSHYDHRVTAARFEPEAARIRAEAQRQLDELRKAPDMPAITDPTSRLLAARIRAQRQTSNWTQAELANSTASLSANQISAIEGGRRAVSVPELAEIASALGVVPEFLMRKGALCEACGQELPQ